MSFRDSLEAAHQRIAMLEAELRRALEGDSSAPESAALAALRARCAEAESEAAGTHARCDAAMARADAELQRMQAEMTHRAQLHEIEQAGLLARAEADLSRLQRELVLRDHELERRSSYQKQLMDELELLLAQDSREAKAYYKRRSGALEIEQETLDKEAGVQREREQEEEQQAAQRMANLEQQMAAVAADDTLDRNTAVERRTQLQAEAEVIMAEQRALGQVHRVARRDGQRRRKALQDEMARVRRALKTLVGA